MSMRLAESLQDTSDFDMDSQSNPIRATGTVAAKLLRELCAGRESPCVLPGPVLSTAGRAVQWGLPRDLQPQPVLLGLRWMSRAQP